MNDLNIMQQLLQTDNPQLLFNKVLDKSYEYGNKEKKDERTNINESYSEEENEENFDKLFSQPVKVSKTTKPTEQMRKINPHAQNQNFPKQDFMKQMLGESYYNKLLNKPIDSPASVLEPYITEYNVQGQYNSNFENYEVVNEQPKLTNQISLTIAGKSYSGKIIQNKKEQILFLINNNQAFVLTPSTLKNVSKK
jgi:aspartate-semialdehyde dehydrogenase